MDNQWKYILVRFSEDKNNLTVVKLVISYELPKALARFMKEDILGKLVTNELQNNLDNFKNLVESGQGK